MSLKALVSDKQTRASKTFDLIIQALILVSIVTFTLETQPNLSAATRYGLNILEVIVVAIFTFEYLLRLYFAEHKLKFIFSFHGLVDLLAILPFYLAVGLDLRSLRILRLFRLFRVFKLAKYSRALERLNQALNSVKDELVVFLLACLGLMYLSSVGIYFFENEAQPEVFGSILQSMWWSLATLTTVGYGDVFPITTGGRIFTAVILFIGLGVIAVPAGLLAAALSSAVKDEFEQKESNS